MRLPALHRLAAGCALLAIGTPLLAANPPTPGNGQDAEEANPTDRPITLTVPLKDGTIYLGDIDILIAPDDHISVPSGRLLALLRPLAGPDLLAMLDQQAKTSSRTDMATLGNPGFSLSYDPHTLELQVRIGAAMRAITHLQIIPGARDQPGTFVRPAGLSAYLNVLGATDYRWTGPRAGFNAPNFYLDGAVRALGVVAESQQYWQPGQETGPRLQRQGSRLVLDDRRSLMRWIAGDLRPAARGFQLPPQMAGIAIERIYSQIDPQSLARPRGGRSFMLARPSTVEVYVNDRLARRLELPPGNYSLSDFPFAQGSNNVRLSIQDNTGQVQDLRFSLFMDQAQLGAGRSEFGLYAGVNAPMRGSGPRYSNNWEISGFYRRGLSDSLTLEATLQADRNAQMLGFEGLVSLPFGVIGLGLAGSRMKDGTSGQAGMATYRYQHLIDSTRMESFRLSVERRSRNFTTVELPAPFNPYAFEASAQYMRGLNDRLYGGISARYSQGRDGRRSIEEVRGILEWRPRSAISLSLEGFHEAHEARKGFGVLIALTARLSPSSSARGYFDNRNERGRLSYQAIHGDGIGSYNLSGDVETSRSGRNASLTANYITNRASLGLNHYANFASNGGGDDQHTSLRAATALAFADGAFSIGRPISNGFAIVTPHRSLGDVPVLVDATPYGMQAKTGALHSALQANLTPYNQRSIAVTAPDAPAGTDLGTGYYRLFPPYRAGYRLKVGSDYNISVTGRMSDTDGLPLALVPGQAIELQQPEREPAVVFTDRQGRFAVSGLRSGSWRIEMQTEPPSTFLLEVAPDAPALVRLGEITPIKEH